MLEAEVLTSAKSVTRALYASHDSCTKYKKEKLTQSLLSTRGGNNSGVMPRIPVKARGRKGKKENEAGGEGRAQSRTNRTERWMSRIAQGDRNANRGESSLRMGMNHPYLSATRPQQAGSFFLLQTPGCF